MNKRASLFSNLNTCHSCGRALAKSYQHELCPSCLDRKLFNEVKEYIRQNRVNEYDVAAQFNLSLRQVKSWIKDGRIEYRYDDPDSALVSLHCQNCGEPISFGSLCSKCMRRSGSHSGSIGKSPSQTGHMHFLDTKDNK